MVSVGNNIKSQVDIKKYWDIDSKSQVGKCKLCPESKPSTAQPEYRKLQSGLKKAYPHWNNMRKHTRTSHFKEYDAASKKRKNSQTQGGMMDDYFKRYCNQDKDENGNQKLTVTFEMSPGQLKNIVRQICTTYSLPFNALEKSGLKQLTNPILQQFKKSN